LQRELDQIELERFIRRLRSRFVGLAFGLGR
jgi:hypothetical protein